MINRYKRIIKELFMLSSRQVQKYLKPLLKANAFYLYYK